MSDGVELQIGEFALHGDRITRRYLTAGTQAVAETTRRLEKALEGAIQAAVPGRLFRAVQSSSFPKRGPARNPVGTVFTGNKARTKGALTYWTMKGSSARKGGKYFAFPLPAAGAVGRLRNLTPDEWERRTGITLRPVFRPGRLPLLVADNAVISGKRQVARANTARRQALGRGNATVPIFVLIPTIRFRGAVAIDPLVRQAQRDLPVAFLAAVAGKA